MDPVCISLVHQYLESTNSALTRQFKTKYQPKETNVKLEEVLSKWNEEQLAKSVVYQQLRAVTPSLATEFKSMHFCSLESVPQQLMYLVEQSQKTNQATIEAQNICKTPEVSEKKKRSQQ